MLSLASLRAATHCYPPTQRPSRTGEHVVEQASPHSLNSLAEPTLIWLGGSSAHRRGFWGSPTCGEGQHFYYILYTDFYNILYISSLTSLSRVGIPVPVSSDFAARSGWRCPSTPGKKDASKHRRTHRLKSGNQCLVSRVLDRSARASTDLNVSSDYQRGSPDTWRLLSGSLKDRTDCV
jgi:hypothetical protein